jgi:hypothetical protein
MESDLKSVSKLFTERLFRIPDYQRGFSWSSKQLQEFWGDLELLEPAHKHYLGVLTLESVEAEKWAKWDDDRWLIDFKSYAPFYVVDGQQRLTSIIILIQCITEKMKINEQLNYDTRDDILSKYVHIQKEGRDGSFVFGYEKDNPSYEYLKTKILNRNSSRYSAGETTIYTKNLQRAKAFFADKIKEYDSKKLSALYGKLTQQLLFNVFHIEEEVDVHVAFETMNNRGLQLSNLELLKNRLIYLTTRLGEPESNTESVRAAINNSWKTVYLYLGRNAKASLSDDYFLTIHFALYFGKGLLESHPKLIENSLFTLTHDGFYKRFLLDQQFTIKRIYSSNPKERLTSTDLYKYSIDLKRVVEQYYRVSFPEDSDMPAEEKVWCGRLRRLIAAAESREIFVALLLFLPLISKSAERIAFLQTAEQYFFLSSLLPYRFTQKHSILKTARELISLAGKRSAPEDLKGKLEEQISQFKAAPNFGDAILEGMGDSGYYGWKDLKYFMYEYERTLKDKAKRKTDKIDWDQFISEDDDEADHSSIEHVLPQTPTDPYWQSQLKGLPARQVRKLTNSLGNLVATSAPRNSSLRNLPFPQKKGNATQKTGYAYGSYSEIEIAQSKDWGPAEILGRGLNLLSFLEGRWNLQLGTDEAKKKCLGLEFLK